ncbi:MAG: histidinol-phosphate aminotransferase family protein [Ignavibacteria bacterium]|nr:histidinol-phosphate aminotransferase family protein [Ignavibacteria bacterium]MCC7159682.1 histidinol-phosphate aminotransferase family protein [Ignavibacteria bacterium]
MGKEKKKSKSAKKQKDSKFPKEPLFLDRNESQTGPVPEVYKFLKKTDMQLLSWYSRDFMKGIKSALSKKIADEYGFDEKYVLLSYGSEDLLKQIIHCYVNPGDKILIPREAWWYYKKVASERGGTNVEYPMKKGTEDGIPYYLYDVDTMIDIYNDTKPKIVVIASPNNPTGNRIDYKDLKRFLDATKDTVTMIDEAYWGFGSTDNSYVKPYIDEFPNLVICRTFSKLFALAGFRIGFAFAGKNLDVLINFTTRYLGYNRVSEKLGEIALDNLKWYLKIGKQYEKDKEMMYREFGRLKGFVPFKSYANFILVDIPVDIRAGLKKYLDERNLRIKFLDEDAFRTEARLSLGTKQQNKLLMDTIKQYCKEVNWK